MTLQTESPIDRSMFRAYDIRGVVDVALTEASVYRIGQAVAKSALLQGEKSLFIARDGRLSGPRLLQALSAGIVATGCDVIDLGMVPTPVLYFAAHVLATRSGVMLTGSHNPPEYNGLKIVIAGKTLADVEIQNLYHSVIEGQFPEGSGQYHTLNIVDRYINHIADTVMLKRPLKVVIDCGNGVPGVIAPALYQALGCDVYPLFCEVDGNFPNHHPDPSQAENLQDLIKAVAEQGADLGLAFDGDGDRLGVVTPKGQIIWADRQLMLFAEDILKRHPGGTIIYDVKCTHHLKDHITKHHGVPLMWKTGHSLVKAKLAETKGLIAGEMSGHIFFKERWFGFDDGLYAGARLLEILSGMSEDIDTVFAGIPDSVNTPELKIYVEDSQKFALMERLVANAAFDSADEVITIDGLRVNFGKGWGLIRPSNTTPCLVLRFEAETETILREIQERFRSLILGVEPGLVLPF